MQVLIQVNISPTERFGVAPHDAPALARQLRDEGPAVEGVMAIGPLEGDVDAAFGIAQPGLRRGRRHDVLARHVGRLGTRDHFGSTMIRIGTAIFGARQPHRKGP